MKIVSKKKVAVGALVATPFVYALLREATNRRKGSLSMRGVSAALRLQGNSMRDTSSFVEGIKSRASPQPAALPPGMRRTLNVTEEEVGGHRVVTLSPKSRGSCWAVVYLHGGAYVNELVKAHWDIIAGIIEATGATVTVPLYPLAPEHDHRHAREFVNRVYERLIRRSRPEHVVFAGDSAGGGFAVGAVLDAMAKGQPLPSRLMLFSPWLDLTLEDAAAKAIEPHDVMLGIDSLRHCGRWWAGGDDPREGVLSPLHADIEGLPPIDIYQGDRDLLLGDARSFARKARLAEVETRYFEYAGAIHVFLGATFTPEARDVFRLIGDTLPRQGHFRL